MKSPISRRAFFKQLALWGAVPVATGAYATQIEPFWPDIHEVEIRAKNLPKSFEGFRIAHVTDLHASEIVPFDYLRKVVKTVDDLRPDIVVATGDFTTHGPKWVKPVCELMATFSMPVFCCLGNHDYGLGGWYRGGPTPTADATMKSMAADDLKLLRNDAVSIDRDGDKLWIAGFEDLWSGRFSPRVGFAKIDSPGPIICLSHNPDTAAQLNPFAPTLICCGHTHGGQIRLPMIGALKLPMNDKRYDQGWFQLSSSQLYVSRGVGYLVQARLLCRPEVPIYVLRSV